MAQEKRFERMTIEHPLVQALVSGHHPWWKRVLELARTNKDINIQVRANSLNVYYKMMNLLQISMAGDQVVCKAHYKYLLAARPKGREYLEVHTQGTDLRVELDSCTLVPSILDAASLAAIKSHMAAHAGEEKKFQSVLVEKNKQTILDAEVAFNGPEDASENEKDGTRIDLVNFDKKREALTLIELKVMLNPEIYSQEINEQIGRYVAFATAHSNQLLKAYNNVIQVKKMLGILGPDSWLSQVVIGKVEPRPILAIACYKQIYVNALREELARKKILDRSQLSGLYFFGAEADLNLDSRGTNQVSF